MKMTTGGDQMQGPNGREEKIFVSVRLRPLNVKERVRNDVADWECINDETVLYRSHLSISERSMYPTAYTFDRVFGPECSTREVYDQGAKEVTLSVVSGVHASVFAYGQTSSGKTYTMSGITDYALADIYDYIEKHKEREFVLKFSAMEIYNESVRDLLSTDISPLRVLDDPEKGTVVEKLTEETLRGWNHFKELLSICIAQRHIGETALNEVSSRSHQILRLTVESTAREYLANGGKFSTLTATVNFIDLAGSERASQSLSAGTRLKEGGHINRSLLTLGTVIRKLSKGKTGHIPFRDSKLTRILQSSLGGNARTAMICTMSPARVHVEQSRNTLLFASCAKEVTTNAQVNVVMSDKVLVKHLQRELAKLESELRSPRQALVVSDTSALLKEKDLQIEKLNEEVFQLAQQLERAHSRIEDLQQIIGESSKTEILSSDSEKTYVVLGHQYPKLRVRSSWESLNITPDSPVSAQPSCMISPQSTEHGSDENVFQLSDFRIDSGAGSPGQHLSFVTPGKFTKVRLNIRGAENKNQPHIHKEESVEQSPVQEERFPEMREPSEVDSEDTFTELRCIGTESPGIIMYPEPNMLPGRFVAVSALPVSVPDSKNIRPPTETGEEEEGVKEASVVFIQPKEKSEPIKASPRRDLSLTDKSFTQKSSKLRRDHTHPDSVTLSPEKPYAWHLERDSQTVGSKGHTRSRSCGTSFVSTSSSPLYEYERDANTPRSWYHKERSESNLKPSSIKRPPLPKHFSRMSMPATWFEKDFNRTQRTPAALDRVNTRNSSPSESQVSPSEAPVYERQTSGRASISQEEGEETAPQRDKRIIHLSMEEIEQKFLALRSTKSFKDAAVDPIQDYLTMPLNWPVEFKRLEVEIIELWHACNVSMAHRSYFFLLFRGDQKDCLYMEVELRRLKYIRETFTHNNRAIENGRTLTTMSSLRALNRERYKLSQLMQKKLTKEERENLFLRWGIGLNTKHRRLQLAHRLWSESKDMDHVRESASVVGKLMGFVDMDLASKEMFGLNFSLKPRPKKSSLWKRSVLSLSIL
ncbi:unnamed protein product [Thlaspi arvense]|uniref:Kinesin motor domain-containing protein n=1 Tax=Thlaspi arvense TaxID=13288 RepID=A0AAU9SEK1_THLAR|nr:unnamed protein product [Thlaspi arvense]